MGWFSSSPAPPQTQSATAQPTSLDGTYTPLKRNERKACWEARDAYFKCLDKHNILDAVKDADAALANCPTENAKYEQDCATSWILYFKQKRVADFNREAQLKKLESQGAVPIAQAQGESKWKLW